MECASCSLRLTGGRTRVVTRPMLADQRRQTEEYRCARDPLDRSHNEFAHSPGRDRLLFALIGTASARHPVARKPTLLAEACNDGTAEREDEERRHASGIIRARCASRSLSEAPRRTRRPNAETDGRRFADARGSAVSHRRRPVPGGPSSPARQDASGTTGWRDKASHPSTRNPAITRLPAGARRLLACLQAHACRPGATGAVSEDQPMAFRHSVVIVRASMLGVAV